MYSLITEASFDSAHFLSGYDGKCSNIHGHRWRVIAEIMGDSLETEGQTRGMVTDFKDIKSDLRRIAESFDHSLIIERGSLKPETLDALINEDFLIVQVAFRPTAENFAAFFFKELQSRGYWVKKIKVYETPDNCAVYSEE